MPSKNVEVVEAIYERWCRGDFSATDWAHEDLEFRSAYAPDGSTLRGIEAMRESWRDFLASWSDFYVRAEEIVDMGDRVVAFAEFGGRGRGSGVPAEGMRGASVFTFRDGRVVGLELLTDRAEALRVAGLEPPSPGE